MSEIAMRFPCMKSRESLMALRLDRESSLKRANHAMLNPMRRKKIAMSAAVTIRMNENVDDDREAKKETPMRAAPMIHAMTSMGMATPSARTGCRKPESPVSIQGNSGSSAVR